MDASGKDIFGYRRNPKPAGAFSTDDSLLTFGSVDASGGGKGTLGLLVQNWNIGYSQQVQEIFELGSNRMYWSKSRPQGQGTLQRVVGFAPATVGSDGKNIMLFPDAAFDVCKGGARFKMSAKGGNCDYVQGEQLDFSKTYGLGITMDGCLVVSIGYSATVNDTRIMENLVWRFAYLELTTES
jgi:hypothetical protein